MKIHPLQLDVSSDEFARRQDRFLRTCGIMLAAAFVASTVAGFNIAMSNESDTLAEVPG